MKQGKRVLELFTIAFLSLLSILALLMLRAVSDVYWMVYLSILVLVSVLSIYSAFDVYFNFPQNPQKKYAPYLLFLFGVVHCLSAVIFLFLLPHTYVHQKFWLCLSAYVFLTCFALHFSSLKQPQTLLSLVVSPLLWTAQVLLVILASSVCIGIGSGFSDPASLAFLCCMFGFLGVGIAGRASVKFFPKIPQSFEHALGPFFQKLCFIQQLKNVLAFLIKIPKQLLIIYAIGLWIGFFEGLFLTIRKLQGNVKCRTLLGDSQRLYDGLKQFLWQDANLFLSLALIWISTLLLLRFLWILFFSNFVSISLQKQKVDRSVQFLQVLFLCVIGHMTFNVWQTGDPFLFVYVGWTLLSLLLLFGVWAANKFILNIFKTVLFSGAWFFMLVYFVLEGYIEYNRFNIAPKGQWHLEETKDQEVDQKRKDLIPDLIALPYLQGYFPATEKENVTIYNPEQSASGWNFYSSGNAPEAYLMDMEGNIIHRWHYEYKNVPLFRTVHLYPNGDILAVLGDALIKLDKNSELIWASEANEHHDIDIDPETGNIYVLSYTRDRYSEFVANSTFINDGFAILSPGGAVINRISFIEAMYGSDYEYLIFDIRDWIQDHIQSFQKANEAKGVFKWFYDNWSKPLMPAFIDPFHSGGVEILDGSFAYRSDIFKKGNILLSIRNIDLIIIIDPEIRKVVWAMKHKFLEQHEVTLLPNGNLLIFANSIAGEEGYSSILEIDPLTRKVVWEYKARAPYEFYTEYNGWCQRLPNGNTLISESNKGRAFEILVNGEIVWEYYNPHRAGRCGELIATLFEMKRYPLDYVQFLETKPDQNKGTN